ncbi:MAG: alpha/beta hydrolase [Myxococcales bacterium]|nr:alpha/beta hydrolase [Myxococcales bacterium]
MLEWGRDDATLDHSVILINGLLDLSWGWASTVGAGLAGRFHIVAPDLRGHGDSDRVGVGGYYHFVDYLADLHSLIESVGRDRVSLVGHLASRSLTRSVPRRFLRMAVVRHLGVVEASIRGPIVRGAWLVISARSAIGALVATVERTCTAAVKFVVPASSPLKRQIVRGT